MKRIPDDAQMGQFMNGLVPRAVNHIFDYIRKNPNKGQFRVTLSFLEIYMEQITDLLDETAQKSYYGGKDRSRSRPRSSRNSQSNFGKGSVSPIRSQLSGRISPMGRREVDVGAKDYGLQIREDPKTGIFVEGLTQVHVKTKEQLLQFVKQGFKKRQVNQTGMNKNSSRSHALLNICLEQIWFESQSNQQSEQAGVDKNKKRHYRKALLTIVDLAGSERLNKTGSESMRLAEAKNINKSIAALGNCIATLAQSQERQQSSNQFLGSISMSHIPFRDSKLTRLLQESLSGNCKTTICACISPSLIHYDESYSTLLFASRAMEVRTAASKNEKIDSKPKTAESKNRLRSLGIGQRVRSRGPGGSTIGFSSREEFYHQPSASSVEHDPYEIGRLDTEESNRHQSSYQFEIRELRNEVAALRDQLNRREDHKQGTPQSVKGLNNIAILDPTDHQIGYGLRSQQRVRPATYDDTASVHSQMTAPLSHLDKGYSQGWLN